MRSVEVKLKPDAKLYASKFYNVPKAYEKMTKKEVHCLCTVSVLEKLSHTTDSPWAAPSFCQIKKIDDPNFLTDFRENKCIQRKKFSLPRINEPLQKIEKFKRATAINLFQGYYSVSLSKKRQKICTTILPWGNYAHKRLLMSIAGAPNIFQ